jgi:hypothetical protein
MAPNCGYRHLDTAQIYENEAVVGERSTKRVSRENLIIATNVCGDSLGPENARRTTAEGLDGSVSGPSICCRSTARPRHMIPSGRWRRSTTAFRRGQPAASAHATFRCPTSSTAAPTSPPSSPRTSKPRRSKRPSARTRCASKSGSRSAGRSLSGRRIRCCAEFF